MWDHTFASASGTNGRAEGIFPMFLHASLWVWRSVCAGFGGVCVCWLSDSICPHSCRSVGVGVSQPSDTSGAKATCIGEELQLSVALQEDDSGRDSGVLGGADTEDAPQRSGGRPPL